MLSKDDKKMKLYLGLSAAVNRGWFPGGLLEKLPFAWNNGLSLKVDGNEKRGGSGRRQ